MQCKPAFAVQSGTKFKLAFPSWVELGTSAFNFDMMRTESVREMVVNHQAAGAEAWHATTDGYVPSAIQMGCSGVDRFGLGTFMTESNTDCDNDNVHTANTKANWMTYALPVETDGFTAPIPDGSNRIFCSSQAMHHLFSELIATLNYD